MYKNILVADDIRMNRTLIIDILRQKFEDINFFEAKTGVEALEIIKNDDIDLIVLDLIMPEMDGYEVLNSLNGSAYSDIPVIISSAVRDIESIEQTLINGANDYFTKPLSANDINIILPLKVKNLLTLYEQKKIITKLNENISEELDMAIKFQTIMLPKSIQ
jgi:sigma-B regulation protein RsbU (phosphoserine phosphatase)